MIEEKLDRIIELLERLLPIPEPSIYSVPIVWPHMDGTTTTTTGEQEL